MFRIKVFTSVFVLMVINTELKTKFKCFIFHINMFSVLNTFSIFNFNKILGLSYTYISYLGFSVINLQEKYQLILPFLENSLI